MAWYWIGLALAVIVTGVAGYQWGASSATAKMTELEDQKHVLTVEAHALQVGFEMREGGFEIRAAKDEIARLSAHAGQLLECLQQAATQLKRPTDGTSAPPPAMGRLLQKLKVIEDNLHRQLDNPRSIVTGQRVS